DRAGRQPGDDDQLLVVRLAVLVGVFAVGERPALDDCNRPAADSTRPPLHGGSGRTERAEPFFCRRLPAAQGAVAAARNGLAQIFGCYDEHKAVDAGASSNGAGPEPRPVARSAGTAILFGG